MRAMSSDDALGVKGWVWGRGGGVVGAGVVVATSSSDCAGVGGEGMGVGGAGVGAGAGVGVGTTSSGACIWCISRANCYTFSHKYELSSRVELQTHRLINKQHASQKSRRDQAQTRSSVRQNSECDMPCKRNCIHYRLSEKRPSGHARYACWCSAGVHLTG